MKQIHEYTSTKMQNTKKYIQVHRRTNTLNNLCQGQELELANRPHGRSSRFEAREPLRNLRGLLCCAGGTESKGRREENRVKDNGRIMKNKTGLKQIISSPDSARVPRLSDHRHWIHRQLPRQCLCFPQGVAF